MIACSRSARPARIVGVIPPSLEGTLDRDLTRVTLWTRSVCALLMAPSEQSTEASLNNACRSRDKQL
jgi:hypothetical protein